MSTTLATQAICAYGSIALTLDVNELQNYVMQALQDDINDNGKLFCGNQILSEKLLPKSS